MIISLDKFKNKGSGDGGNGKYVVTDGTKFACSEWEYIPEELDFSQVTRYDNMFNSARIRHGFYLDDWSKVTNCAGMYGSCRYLESVPDMNTSNCINFNSVFEGSTIVNAPNIDVSSASTVQFMFNICPNLQRIGVLNTINVNTIDGFHQLCTYCPNLTTIEGIDFSGIVDSTVDNSYNGPTMFLQTDSLTNITVNGAINFSWANDYGFNALPNLTFESIESILTAMSKCINPEEPKTMYFNYKCQDDTLRPLIEDCQSKGWDIQGIRFNGEEDDDGDDDGNTPGVFFDDGDAPITIPYTSETQELTIPFNWYPGGGLSWHENCWTNGDIGRKGIDCNIEVIEGTVEGYTHALHIVVGPNVYNGTINDAINFSYIDSDGNDMHYVKAIDLQANPDSQLGFISVSANYDNYASNLPSSVDRFEILFNIENAEYQETIIIEGNLENFNVSFEPTDVEGYNHVAYITYDNKSYEYAGSFELKFSNGYYEEGFYLGVDVAKLQSDVDTSVWGNPDEAIPVTMAEFIAAEPSTTQWYEIKGRILIAPQAETGRMIIQPIDGDTGQTIYFVNDNNDIETLENALFVNYCWDVAMMNPVEGVENSWFPGDGANIIIRTLKHSYDTNVDTIERLSEDNNGTTVAGKYNGSPCAIYVGTEPEPEPEPEPDIESNPFYRTVDTAAFGDPSNAIPVTFTEFAAAEPSNEQWYEFSGVIRGCPALEKGILVLDDPKGEYTVDEPQLNSWPLEGSPGIFIFGITTELNSDNDDSFVGVFPGDGQVIRIRTLRHTTDTDYSLIYGDLPAGSIIGGKFNSPCAVYLGDGSWRPA